MAIRIALAGNPNCGKTTLFNALTGSNQFVGNWPGVTVEKKEGKLKGHKDVIITDLPGIYSLSPYTLEEVVARNYILNEKPDAILNIVDGTNLERNLYLTTQLMELGIPVIMAINMMDLVQKNGDNINIQKLSEVCGCPVYEISALKNTASSPDYSMDGTLGDEGEGMGLYLYDNEDRAYLCASEDGNSFTLSGQYPGRYSDDGHFDGVFYRDGDIAAYTDLEKAKFYYGNGSDTWLWYNDGVNEYFLGDEYKIGDDGLAYYEADNKVYPGGWIPDEPYDPSVDWGENAQEETSINLENDFSHFEGIWYYDGDLSAETYIVMDASGNWSYYQRAPGAEPVEMDCGTLTQDADAADIYYAESTMYDGVSHQVFAGDGDVFLWDEEGNYYLME